MVSRLRVPSPPCCVVVAVSLPLRRVVLPASSPGTSSFRIAVPSEGNSWGGGLRGCWRIGLEGKSREDSEWESLKGNEAPLICCFPRQTGLQRLGG